MFAFFFHANGQQESLQTASPPPLTLWSRKPLPGPVMVGTQSADSTELRTHDGLTIQGLLIQQGDPLMMRSMGNVTQLIPANRVAAQRRMNESLMMSAAQLGLNAQDVADLVALLRAQ